MSELVYVPVSVGELFDKYTILQIKELKINDQLKLKNVIQEINYLKPFINKYKLDLDVISELSEVNLLLWNIEDKIREKERRQEFDEEFIQLARNVYITNDKRSQVKNKINLLLNSCLTDIKSYEKY
jgi:hypothetical protein